MKSRSGFNEIHHTADCAVSVWAPTYTGLLAESARGMYAIMGCSIDDSQQVIRRINLEAEDGESLLVLFLSELLFQAENKNLAFHVMDVHMDGWKLKAEIIGNPITRIDRQIKAVTYNDLLIQTTPSGLLTVLVFDV